MEKKIGDDLLAGVTGLKQVFDVKEDKAGVYSFRTPTLQVNLVIIPGKEIGIDIKLSDSGKPTLFYSIDNDLYELNDPSNYEANRSTEIEIIEAIKEHKIILGQRKKKGICSPSSRRLYFDISRAFHGKLQAI